MQATATVSATLPRPPILAPASLKEALTAKDPPRPETGVAARVAALDTAPGLARRRFGLARDGATTMDAVEQWVCGLLWLCCLFSLVYCFAAPF